MKAICRLATEVSLHTTASSPGSATLICRCPGESTQYWITREAEVCCLRARTTLPTMNIKQARPLFVLSTLTGNQSITTYEGSPACCRSACFPTPLTGRPAATARKAPARCCQAAAAAAGALGSAQGRWQGLALAAPAAAHCCHQLLQE